MTTKHDPITQEEWNLLTQQRETRAKFELGKKASTVSIAEQLLILLRSPLKKTITSLFDQLAALTEMADGNQAARTDQPQVSMGEKEVWIPSFTPGWADRRLDQADQFLFREAEALQAWLNRPGDPSRQDLCPKCSNPAVTGDYFCRHCGTRISEADEKAKLRVRCLRSRCSRSKKPIPKFIRHGRSWIELVVCSGILDGDVCGSRLKDM